MNLTVKANGDVIRLYPRPDGEACVMSIDNHDNPRRTVTLGPAQTGALALAAVEACRMMKKARRG